LADAITEGVKEREANKFDSAQEDVNSDSSEEADAE
jgi:hypothetical protein